jgi:hypothetical protein
VLFPLPPLGVSATLVSFAVIAVAMIAITIFVLGKVLPRDGRPPLVTQMLLALAVVGGGSVLLLALVFVFLDPNGTTAWTWVLLAFNFMMMGPAGIWFIGLVVFRDRRIRTDDWSWPIAFGLVTTGSEVLMGFLFALGGEAAPLPALPTVALGLSSVWFFWSMASIMAALVLWAPLAPVERGALVALTIASVLGPWVTTFPTIGGAGMTVLMVGAFGYLVRATLRPTAVRSEEIGLLIGLAFAFLAMAIAGIGLVATAGSVGAVLAFGSVMAVAMGIEIAYLIRRFYLGTAAVPWIHRAPEDDEVSAPRPAPVVGRTDGPSPEPGPALGP